MDMEAAVRAFHDKFGFVQDRSLAAETAQCADARLWAISIKLEQFAEMLKHMHLEEKKYGREGDQRIWRAHLLIEELSELIRALSDRKEVDLMDAIGDLMYVVIGTKVTYDLPPIDKIMSAIQRSNMSKVHERSSNPANQGVWEPPLLKELLDEHH